MIKNKYKMTGYQLADIRKKYGYSCLEMSKYLGIGRNTYILLEELKLKYIAVKYVVILFDKFDLGGNDE